MIRPRIVAHALEGVANKLREGLNNEGYELQEAARILRMPDEDRRSDYNRDNVLAYIKETANSLRDLAGDLEDVLWEAEFYTCPPKDDDDPPSDPEPAPEPGPVLVDLAPAWTGLGVGDLAPF